MCGIIGCIPAVSHDLFKLALTSIAHRGPDGEGIWDDGEYALLGHRRLSILDRSNAGSQPMHWLERYHIVFNGEIYNFLEIRDELESLGIIFKSNSDTEVLLAAYVMWGEKCLARLNGMWAFAIWDDRDKKLFLSRDRMGEKPLFYIDDGRRFIFASEQKALLPFLKHVRPADNFSDLSQNQYDYESTKKTLFKGISRFPAAHYGFFADGNLILNRYWAPLERPVDIPSNYFDQVEMLRELLVDSCSIRLRSDIPVATALSGGIDSSAIAACVSIAGNQQGTRRLSMSWQNAFVAGFPGSDMDESAPARSVAHHLNIRLKEVQVLPFQSGEDLEKIAYLFEDIHEVNPLPHVYLYREMRKHGILVSLDGHGGDELFGGYESSILHAIPSALWNQENISGILNTYRSIHPKNSQFKGMSNQRIALYLLKSEIVNKVRDRQGDSAITEVIQKSDSLNSHLIRLAISTVLPTLLRNYDRYSMMNGVEIRSPFLDHRVVDMAFNLPWSSKIRNGYSKSILRDAVAPWIPENIIKNKTKIGFSPPIIDWLRGPLREYLLDEISSQQFRYAELIRPEKLGNALLKVILGSDNAIHYEVERLWKEFSIYLWEKAFLNRTHH